MSSCDYASRRDEIVDFRNAAHAGIAGLYAEGPIRNDQVFHPSLPHAVLEPPVVLGVHDRAVQLLKELAPGLKRAAMIFNPDTAPYIRSFFLPSYEAAAQSFRVAAVVAPVHSDAEIETVIAGLGRGPRGGLLVMPDNFVEIHRATIIA